nr:siderophore-interacting protein [Tianweitania sediminis]
MNDSSAAADKPLTTRIKHELVRRRLTVKAVDRLSPGMVRILLGGDELKGFTSAAPDDHIKLFFGDDMRDFTPRFYDPEENTLAVDFVLHAGGPAGDFAARAKVGDHLTIGGPRGSLVVSDEVTRWLLIGDETALPAIARRLEELRPGNRAQAVVVVADPDEEQPLTSPADCRVTWVHRPASQAGDATAVIDVVRALLLTPDTFIFVGAEASVAKALRHHLLERGHPRAWIKAAGYWVKGAPGEHQPLDD